MRRSFVKLFGCWQHGSLKIVKLGGKSHIWIQGPLHWGASFFRRHRCERDHWEMGNVSLWGRVTFGARAIERRQSGGESGAREAIVLHPGDISCTHLNHTWLEHIFLENFTTIIDEVNLLHTNKQLYIKSIFWSQGCTFNCNSKKNSLTVFLLALSSPKHNSTTSPFSMAHHTNNVQVARRKNIFW